MIAVATGRVIVCAFTARAGQQINARQITALGSLQVLIGGKSTVNPGLNFRVRLQSRLHGLLQGLR